MVSITILLGLSILFAGNAAAAAIDMISLGCMSGTTTANSSGPTRMCLFEMYTSEHSHTPMSKECDDASLVSFVSDCKGLAWINVTYTGIVYDPGFPNEECYARQCNVRGVLNPLIPGLASVLGLHQWPPTSRRSPRHCRLQRGGVFLAPAVLSSRLQCAALPRA